MSAGYGVDTWCTDLLQPARYARGPTLVAQAIYRRLITPRGTLLAIDDDGGHEEDIYGYDVSGLVGSVGYDTALQTLPGIIRGEILKDDRVDPATFRVVVTKLGDSPPSAISLLVEISGSLADEAGDFALTLSVTDLTVQLLGGLS